MVFCTVCVRLCVTVCIWDRDRTENRNERRERKKRTFFHVNQAICRKPLQCFRHFRTTAVTTLSSQGQTGLYKIKKYWLKKSRAHQWPQSNTNILPKPVNYLKINKSQDHSRLNSVCCDLPYRYRYDCVRPPKCGIDNTGMWRGKKLGETLKIKETIGK